MLVILYGKTGAGKDYTANKLVAALGLNAFLVKRPTTRPQRSKHEETYYHFLPEHLFLEQMKTQDILFGKKFHRWYYGVYFGITAQARDRESIYIMTCDKETAFDVADRVRRTNGAIAMVIEVVADKDVRFARAKARESNPDIEEIKRRMQSDDEDYRQIKRKPDLFYISDGPFQRLNFNKLTHKILITAKGEQLNDKK